MKTNRIAALAGQQASAGSDAFGVLAGFAPSMLEIPHLGLDQPDPQPAANQHMVTFQRFHAVPKRVKPK